jgi:hypothetical protein
MLSLAEKIRMRRVVAEWRRHGEGWRPSSLGQREFFRTWSGAPDEAALSKRQGASQGACVPPRDTYRARSALTRSAACRRWRTAASVASPRSVIRSRFRVRRRSSPGAAKRWTPSTSPRRPSPLRYAGVSGRARRGGRRLQGADAGDPLPRVRRPRAAPPAPLPGQALAALGGGQRGAAPAARRQAPARARRSGA